jgi:hypothetical protein
VTATGGEDVTVSDFVREGGCSGSWGSTRPTGSFVIAGNPSWREAEYALMGDREVLYDASKPWPPDFPVESGTIGC